MLPRHVLIPILENKNTRLVYLDSVLCRRGGVRVFGGGLGCGGSGASEGVVDVGLLAGGEAAIDF